MHVNSVTGYIIKIHSDKDIEQHKLRVNINKEAFSNVSDPYVSRLKCTKCNV